MTNRYLIAGTFLAGAALALTIAATAAPEPTPEPAKEAVTLELPDLPACETEDSTGCYWDADVQGNQQGTDIVTQPEYPTEGMPEDFDPETDSTAPIQVPYEGQWDEVPEGTLVCGEDAMPAIDYNEVWGWWAYCEPALID